MRNCDVIVNPHKPMALFNQGIFPFKIIESVASGRVVVSTELGPLDKVDLEQILITISPDPKSLVAGIESARKHHEVHAQRINSVSEIVEKHYSISRIESDIRKMIQNWKY
jgi:glycosyltransferase involved in cell wall biosynthesis